MTEFFADTYAILALLNGDEAYARRFTRSPFRTGTLNVLEARFAQLANDVDLAEVQANLAPFEAAAEEPSKAVLAAAASERLRQIRKRLQWTMIDAIGYSQARALAMPFLTGDPLFESAEGVEFLKERQDSRRK